MEEDLRNNYKAHKVWFTAFHAALGSFIFSYNIGLFTSNQPCVASTLGWSSSEKDNYVPIISSLLPLGALFGALGSGVLSKYIGRRQNLIIADLIIILASIVTVIPYTVTFGLGRFISGIGIGNFSMLCPLYIMEITPKDISGKIGSMVMLFGCIGSLFVFGIALALPTKNYDSDPMTYLWMAMFLFQGVVALIQLTLFLLVFPHETPHWLMNKGYRDKALESLATIYKRPYAEMLIERMASPNFSNPNNEKENGFDFTYRQIFTCSTGITKAMRIGLLLSIIQQFAGINAILFYATTIFGDFGGGVFMARTFTMLSGVVKLISVFGLLPLIDNIGRKKVLIWGCVGMSACLGVMGVFSVYKVYYVFPFLVIETYLALFVISIGPIVSIYSGEILPSRGMSICMGANWFSAFLVVLFFPYMIQFFGLSYSFWFFSFVNLAGAGYFSIDMIETKGLTRHEIREMFVTGKKVSNYSINQD